MFQNLGMVEIDITGREIVREAIKFLRYAPQYVLHVRLDGHIRQSPSVVSFRMIVASVVSFRMIVG
jgi:hypothetical protein